MEINVFFEVVIIYVRVQRHLWPCNTYPGQFGQYDTLADRFWVSRSHTEGYIPD